VEESAESLFCRQLWLSNAKSRFLGASTTTFYFPFSYSNCYGGSDVSIASNCFSWGVMCFGDFFLIFLSEQLGEEKYLLSRSFLRWELSSQLLDFIGRSMLDE